MPFLPTLYKLWKTPLVLNGKNQVVISYGLKRKLFCVVKFNNPTIVWLESVRIRYKHLNRKEKLIWILCMVWSTRFFFCNLRYNCCNIVVDQWRQNPTKPDKLRRSPLQPMGLQEPGAPARKEETRIESKMTRLDNLQRMYRIKERRKVTRKMLCCLPGTRAKYLR